MPYYTRKGTSKKDKGKTCVYKKEDNTKVGCTAGPVEKYLAALHINESEEDDLNWIELTNPTLQQYFDSQALNLGDKLWLRGNTDNEDGSDQIYVDGVFTITGGVNKKYLNSVAFDTTDDIKELLGIDADQPHFLASDGNLEVYRIEKVDQLNEYEDLDWLSGPTQIRFGDIKDNFKDYISVGDTIYISGTLQMVDNGEDLNYDNSIHLDMEPVIVKVPFYTNGDRLEVKFGENITDKPLWSGNISDDWLDLGGFRSDYNLLITVPEKKGVNESEEDDLNWIKNTIPNPLELYYFKGFDDVGIIINSFEESKYIINILQSMSYEWISNTIGDNYNPFSPDEMVRDGGGIIWANKDKELQHSSLDYELDEGEIIIDNPFSSTSLSESNENNDLSWIGDIGKDIEGFIEKLSSLIKEYVPVADLELDWDQTHGGGEYFGRVWLYDTFYELYKYGKTFTVRFYQQDPENNEYYQFDSYEDLSQTHLLTILLNKMIDVNRKNLNESEEFGDFTWAQEIEADLVPGEIYDIKTGNGYYWVPELYVGKEWDDEHNIEMYKFKDLDGSGSGAKSTPYIKELIQKGHIRPYDPNWSIKDELTFSDNIEDALKGNFVIYFKDGVYLDQTLTIQDRLFEMGFSFYTKGPNEYITNKDSSDKIQFFECFNWDTSNPRYSSMPPNQWDLKKILLVKVSDEDTRWRRTRNPRLEEQELFLTVSSHDAIIIDGDRYITNSVNESKEFDWIHQQEPEKELKKTKSYVVDVSHLRPTPMRHSHDTSLTRQDILRRFKDLGYDVDGIDVDEAKYFYIEPNKGIGWDYNEYGVPIEYDYWIDYNTHYMEDPSYGGKYQSIDIDELMFLLDNNLISESDEDMSWLTTSMGEPMSVCDAQFKLKAGDNIMINELPDYDKIEVRSRGKILENVTALVLDINKCNNIQPDNMSSLMTILIHVNDDYLGFDDSWLKSFANEEHKKICSDGRCMFLICGESYDDVDIKITKLNTSFLGESENNDLGWMLTSIPSRRDKIDFNKDRFETTLDYGSDVNVGDRFIPPGGNIIWTVERKQISNRGNSYSVALKSEKNKLKFYDWNPDYGFPSYYRPWKKIIGPKKSITESAGISFESRVWTDIIYDEIMSKPEEKTRIIIDGYNYPEAFDKFPIDYVVIDYYDRITGYGQDYSGYDNDGNYIVHLYIQPKLVRGQGGYSLKSTLNHEMRHAWEDYNRRSKGLPSIDDTKEAKELYNKDFIHLMSDNKVVGPIKDVLKYFYYLSKLETGPYMENVYDQNPTYESLVREIATKDFENFKERFDLELNWHLINTNYNIPFTKKFKSATDFIDYSAKELRKRAHKVIKKINKVKYVHGKMN